jgi:hypothetical protein
MITYGLWIGNMDCIDIKGRLRTHGLTAGIYVRAVFKQPLAAAPSIYRRLPLALGLNWIVRVRGSGTGSAVFKPLTHSDVPMTTGERTLVYKTPQCKNKWYTRPSLTNGICWLLIL